MLLVDDHSITSQGTWHVRSWGAEKFAPHGELQDESLIRECRESGDFDSPHPAISRIAARLNGTERRVMLVVRFVEKRALCGTRRGGLVSSSREKLSAF